MNCSVIKDLIPLYLDDCCSGETAMLVEEHIENCQDCKNFSEEIKTPFEIDMSIPIPTKLNRVEERKASVLQSILLFVSFAIITIGVSLESQTPSGFGNGYFAFSLVVPATGFMLSLVNWYFVRFYRSRKSFSNFSLLWTFLFTSACFAWSSWHYGIDSKFFNEILNGISAADSFEMAGFGLSFMAIGIVLTVALCFLSKVLSNKYAKLLGKE